MAAGRSWAGIAVLAVLVGCGEAPREEGLDPWPFSVDRVELSCVARRVYVSTADGMRYAVNGSARGDAPDISAIATRWNTSAVITRGLALCDAGETSVGLRPFRNQGRAPVEAPGTSRLSTDELLGGTVLTSTDAASIDGRLPELRLRCDGKDRDVGADLARGPRTPPPLRGVFAQFEVDGRSTPPVEVAWATDAAWRTRSADDARVLAKVLAGARTVTVTLPPERAPAGPVRWTIDLPAGERARLVRACD